jgi:phospholipid-binding lipoprotein MlaA
MAFVLLLLPLVVGPLAGCATAPPQSDAEAYAEFRAINDPLEPLNRGVFEFNRGVDGLLLKPLAEFYRLLLPPPVQTGIHNVLKNLRAPVTFANDLLQFEFDRAATTAGRFAINSTLGLGGFIDWAEGWGLPYHDEDFGQTLAVWGAPEGPFLMLPLLGPSNPRDAAGVAVDSTILDPLGFIGTFVFDESFTLRMISYTRLGLTAIDARARNYDAIADLERNSLDFYAALRSLYRQYRRSEIYQGNPPPEPSAGPTLD